MSQNAVQQPRTVTGQPMPPSLVRRLAPGIPYVAILIGMYGLHNVWISMVGYHLGMVAVLSLEKQWSHVRRLWAGYSSWQMVPAVLGGVCAGGILYLCGPWFLTKGNIGDQLERFGLTATSWPLCIAYFLLVNPWLEELTWQSYLSRPDKMPTRYDLYFAGYHLLVMAPFVKWPWLLATLATLVATSWAWRQLASRNNGLLIPLISHACADAGIIITTYVFSTKMV